jgi:hypothetical protein
MLMVDLQAAEKEILLGNHTDADRELLQRLKGAIDDFRLTVWSSIVSEDAGPARQQQIQSIRMTRVVDMLRQINRHKQPTLHSAERPFTFEELMRVAEQTLSEVHGNSN